MKNYESLKFSCIDYCVPISYAHELMALKCLKGFLVHMYLGFFYVDAIFSTCNDGVRLSPYYVHISNIQLPSSFCIVVCVSL